MSRQFRRATATLIAGLMAGTVLILLLAGPASAEVTRGTCSGRAEFPSKTTDQILATERPRSEVFTIPKQETVAYSGTLREGAEPFETPVAFEGGISVRLPRSTWQVIGWGGESTAVSVDGTYTYEIPSFVPAGTGAFEVTTWHEQGDADCEVVVSVQLDGKPGPAALIAVAGTAVFGAGVLAAGSKKRMRG